jgi:hypothetical protein
MTAEGEREKAAAGLQHPLRNLDQAQASLAAVAVRDFVGAKGVLHYELLARGRDADDVK